MGVPLFLVEFLDVEAAIHHGSLAQSTHTHTAYVTSQSVPVATLFESIFVSGVLACVPLAAHESGGAIIDDQTRLSIAIIIYKIL